MKLSKLKEKIKTKIGIKCYGNSLKEEFRVNHETKEKINVSNKELATLSFEKNSNGHKEDDICIIGVTGSKGKSTVCCLIHDYLKSMGYKSILYSSIKIDSPNSIKDKGKSCEVALQSFNSLYEIIEEAESYKAQFLILEVNESAIEKHLIDDIEFDVRVLTNINPKNSLDTYEIDEYVNLKKSFFKDINVNCKCVMGMVEPFTREEFNDFLRLNENEKYTYSSRYYCESFNADYRNVDVLAYSDSENDVDSLKGLDFSVLVNGMDYNIKTKMIMPHNIFNIVCVLATLKSINVLDMEKFISFIKVYKLNEREEIINVNGRTIIIGMGLQPHLEIFNKYKNKGDINKIKLVIGSPGKSFSTWNDRIVSLKREKETSRVRKNAIKYASNYVDKIYITSNDPGSSNPYIIAKELESYAYGVDTQIIVNRKEAIKESIINSNYGDLIYIAGRANRENYCASETEMILFKDKDIVKDTIALLGWY